MINGRRLAPAGVEGAPVAADLNLIPASLVQQYDILLDGASSVYGSDAVAGVTNIIMRKDFDGFELEGYTNIPDQGAGVNTTLSAIWGKNFDRGFIGIGAEFEDSEPVTLDDRRWTEGCNRNAEIDENGMVRTRDVFYQNVYGMDIGECRLGALAGRISSPGSGYGSVYWTPGNSNSGIPNFSESSLFGFGVDADGDGQTDVNFRNHDLNGRTQEAHLFPDVQRTSVMAYGEYTLSGEMNLTPFFEAMYNKREFFSDGGTYQLFPSVGANNPYNPCNPNGIDGVDCGLAFDSLMNNPNFVNQVLAAFGCDPSSGGSCDQTGGAIGPSAVQPIAAVDGDRTNTEAEVEQTRVVLGLRGDIPALNVGSFSNWTFEVAGSFTESSGISSRMGVRGDKLNASTSTSELVNGEVVCGDDADSDGIPDGVFSDPTRTIPVGTPCVPINMFAASLYEGVVGDFATQAERDYVFDSRDFDTTYKQTIVSGYMTGEAFEMPAGPVSIGLGFENRDDEIQSIPDEVARDGLFFGFFSDGGATGEKNTREFFGETELPLLANVPLATELNLNLSGRYTDDEYYGSATTYSAKLGWRPVDSLLLRATRGTSYRAPNLRENFLQNQSGFGNIFDPCGIPDAALDPLSGGYNPALDTREAEVLANCVAQGVDPTTLDFGGFNTYSVEIASGGALDLNEETSDSTSLGFAFQQPWFDSFDMNISATYYKISIENAIIEPSGSFIVFDCYNDPQFDSSFCSRIARDADGRLDLIDAGFINRDNETVKGVDVNIAFDKNVTIFDRPFDLGVDVALNRSLRLSETFLNDVGEPDFDDDQGEFGVPDWRGRIGLRADWDKWRLTWSTNYLGSVKQDPDGVDPFDNGITGLSDTCLGPPTDVLCARHRLCRKLLPAFRFAVFLWRCMDVWRRRAEPV
ncbi:MAG: TonB-dependent receptor [Woeseiaceae bacterium]|nr:TonB-dependent receptor [Woeseiaceae bacterium]